MLLEVCLRDVQQEGVYQGMVCTNGVCIMCQNVKTNDRLSAQKFFCAAFLSYISSC